MASPSVRHRAGGSAARMLPLLGLLLAPAALAVPPTLSPLQTLPGDEGVAAVYEWQQLADIATGGPADAPIALAVWQDQRTALTPPLPAGAITPGMGNMKDIYACRLDADGNLVDAAPIVISNASYNQTRPRVAWNGQSWLVVWTGQSVGDYSLRTDIVAVRIGADGAILDGTPIPIRLQGADQAPIPFDPVVVSDGSGWLVVWGQASPSDPLQVQLRATRVSSTGGVLDPGGAVLYEADFQSSPDKPSVAFSGGIYLVTWTRGVYGDLQAARFNPQLQRLDATPISLSTHTTYVGARTVAASRAASFAGDDFLVAWPAINPANGNAMLVGTRVTRGGQVLDPSGLLIDADGSVVGGPAMDPAIAWDGANWFVAYFSSPAATGPGVYVRRITPAGAVQASRAIVTSPLGLSFRETAIAARGSAGGGVQALWTDPTIVFDDNIAHAVVAADGTPGVPGLVSVGPPRQSWPRLETGAGQHLAVYQSEIGGLRRLMAQRFDAAGNPIDAEPIVVASSALTTAGSIGVVSQPAAGWNGSLYLIAWQRRRDVSGFYDVYGRRMAGDGTFLDAQPVLLFGNARSPNVAALGDTFLVSAVYQQGLNFVNIRAERVRGSDGTVLDPSPIYVWGDGTSNPRAAALGNRWLLTWTRPGSASSLSWVEGAFIDPSGIRSPVFTLNTATYAKDQDLAVGGDRALVAWGISAIPELTGIRGRFVGADGGFPGPDFQIADPPHAQFSPRVAFDGGQYVVAWNDYRDVATLDQLRGDVYAARIDASGAVMDPDGFAVSSGPMPEEQVDVTAMGGVTILAFPVLTSPHPETYRMGYRVFDPVIAGVGGPAGTPAGLMLEQNLPNPFGVVTEIRFRVPEMTRVALRVYDVLGHAVRTLMDAPLAAGPQVARWDGRDDRGRAVASGVYLCRLEAGARFIQRRMTLIR